jgi:hypothetical protein
MTKVMPPAAQLRADGGDAPITTLGQTLATLLARNKAGKFKQGDLARFLAVIVAHHEAFGRVPPEYQGASNAPVPVEIISMVGALLTSKEGWTREATNARSAVAEERTARVRSQAEEIRQRRIRQKQPRLSKTALAKSIAPEFGMKVATVRRLI